LTASTALVFGNEHRGISESMNSFCDGNFIIPQVGMIESLNISVACAVSLYEAFRQKNEAGHFRHKKLNANEEWDVLNFWQLKAREDSINSISLNDRHGHSFHEDSLQDNAE
jgi:tRNA (guanosine-2'-O-)-methyltransferase